MKKFLILYQSATPARDQMAGASPEQAKAGMDAWMAWAKKAGKAIVDLGVPLADVGNNRTRVSGFSILQANSAGEIEQLLKDHPHRKMPGASIETHEFLDLPGMSKSVGDREMARARQ